MIGLLAYCCIVGLCRRFLFVVFPAVFVMRGGYFTKLNCQNELILLRIEDEL